MRAVCFLKMESCKRSATLEITLTVPTALS